LHALALRREAAGARASGDRGINILRGVHRRFVNFMPPACADAKCCRNLWPASVDP
jgi:hypothetical protein